LIVSENIAVLLRHPAAFLSRRRYIFVLSHMRSYSSLFCHILGSHEDVAGYAEMHQRYANRLDLMRLRMRVFRSLEGELRGRFVLDKILHNEYSVSETLINYTAVYPIFLLRRPEDAVTSIVRMGKRIQGEWYSDPSAAVDYYVTRLHELARLARRIRTRFLFLKAENLITTPESTLRLVAAFLDLAEPLEESYSLFKHTGKPGWGDDSDEILQGRIARERAPREAIVLDRGLLTPARHAYEESCRVLEGATTL
jgi:hypothetical protein